MTQRNDLSLLDRPTTWRGDTKPISDELQGVGAAYDGRTRSWLVPPLTGKNRERAERLLNSRPGIRVFPRETKQ